jgi:hypothetical protein
MIPRLPATGPCPEQFSATGRGMQQEGIVIEFFPEGKPSWIGNFQSGSASYSAVLPQLDGTSLVVIAGRHMWLIWRNVA